MQRLFIYPLVQGKHGGIMSNSQDFEQFMTQRLNAAGSYVQGDAEPLERISTHTSPATFFHPRGGYYQGSNEVISKYKDDAIAFAPGSETSFEVLQMGASDSLAFWVGIQHAQARMKGSDDVIPMDIRVTELFRREGDEWKMIHRHADALVSKTDNKK